MPVGQQSYSPFPRLPAHWTSPRSFGLGAKAIETGSSHHGFAAGRGTEQIAPCALQSAVHEPHDLQISMDLGSLSPGYITVTVPSDPILSSRASGGTRISGKIGETIGSCNASLGIKLKRHPWCSECRHRGGALGKAVALNYHIYDYPSAGTYLGKTPAG